MRTTIVIDDALWPQLKAKLRSRQLSAFINDCVRAYFEAQERANARATLEKAYQRAAKSQKIGVAFDALDREDWPEW